MKVKLDQHGCIAFFANEEVAGHFPWFQDLMDIPAGLDLTTAPAGQCWMYRNGVWELCPDHRGRTFVHRDDYHREFKTDLPNVVPGPEWILWNEESHNHITLMRSSPIAQTNGLKLEAELGFVDRMLAYIRDNALTALEPLWQAYRADLEQSYHSNPEAAVWPPTSLRRPIEPSIQLF